MNKQDIYKDLPLIYQYTRADAIADGVLIDVSQTAIEAGFIHPTALTQSVWENYVEVPDGIEGQDEGGRLWDILFALRNAADKNLDTDTLIFTVLVNNDGHQPQPVELKVICGPGDTLEPVITVMLPEED